MKIFFWLLIAVNVILFAVMKSGIFDGAGAAATLVPLHAEKIMLMPIEPMPSAPLASAPLASAQSVPVVALVQSMPVAVAATLSASVTVSAPLPAPGAVSAPVLAPTAAGVCYEWGEFSGSSLNLVKNALAKLSLGEHLSQRETVTNFWVYIPPLNHKDEISQKLLQLKHRGVTDYFVVQDAGAWQNAISLGLFKSRDAAQSFLQNLHNKGVSSAQIGERGDKNHAVVFVINGADANIAIKLGELQKEYATTELKRVQCH